MIPANAEGKHPALLRLWDMEAESVVVNDPEVSKLASIMRQ